MWVEKYEFRGQFVTVSLWQNNVSRFTCGASGLPDHGFWPDLQHKAYVSSCGVGLKYNQNAVGYPSNVCAIIAPVGISCCLVVICTSEISQVNNEHTS